MKAPGSENYLSIKKKSKTNNTVCEEAMSNIGECWDRGTATFMILGDTCTRACSYCNVKTGWPITVDESEPISVSNNKNMDLK